MYDLNFKYQYNGATSLSELDKYYDKCLKCLEYKPEVIEILSL